MTLKKRTQVLWSLPTGNSAEGANRLARWKKAALTVMNNNPKLFNTWLRQVLDTEADRILKK